MKARWWKGQWWLWVAGLLLLLALLLALLWPRPAAGNPFSIIDFSRALERSQVASVYLEYQGDTVEVRGTFKDGTRFVTRTWPSDPLLAQENLQRRGVALTVQSSGVSAAAGLNALLSSGLLLLLLLGMRQRPAESPAGTFGKSRAAALQEGQVKVTFADVAGCDEAKHDLAEVVDFLRSPAKYHALGARIPKGTLLVGPPGSGKTLLARSVAGEAGVPFFALSGSDFVEMFVGVGAARVRDLFDKARKAAPCIVFIDEIDAVGRKRGTGTQGNDEREQTLNQLLVELDGFGAPGKEGADVILLAATNRVDVLDAALLRPGRFDRQVMVDAPDAQGREQILKVHARNKPLSSAVNLKELARQTPGMVGADLENVLNEAALGAARRGSLQIEPADLEGARDRVLMGPERRRLVLSVEDRRVTAYHEVGHALAAQLLPHADKVHKLSVVPRGRSLGAAMYLPGEGLHVTQEVLLDRIAVALAGHATEELLLGSVTTGAQSDFEQATMLARRMVTQWGMSRLGHLALQRSGYAAQGGGYSEITANQIDEEVLRLLREQYQRALQLLGLHQMVIVQVSEVLLEREVLSGEEFAALVTGATAPAP